MMDLQILYIVPYAPTPIRVRPFNLVRHLAKLGHRVTLVTTWTGPDERAALNRLVSEQIRVIALPLSRTRILGNCLSALPSSVPLQAMYCWQPELARRILSELGQGRADLVHVEHLRGAQFGLCALAETQKRHPRVPVIWDSVDCISALFEQAATISPSVPVRTIARVELSRTRRYEARLVGQFDQTIVVSERERKAFGKLLNGPRDKKRGATDTYESSEGKIRSIGNGVDLEFFAPFEGERAAHTIVMTGKMSYHANVAAAQFLLEEIMPRVWDEMPEMTVQIVGQNPPRSLHQLARRSPGRVQVTGGVPDLRPFLERAAMAVAPMVYSAGIQNKLIEAMAVATPVITTPNALEPLGAIPERDVLVGADAEAFSQQIVRMDRDGALRRLIGANGRRYVEMNHNWRQVAREFESVYHLMVENFHE